MHNAEHFHPKSPLMRVQSISRWMAWVCCGLMVSLPIGLALFWATASTTDLAQHVNLTRGILQTPLQPWQRWAGVTVMAMPMLMLVAGMWQAKRCFDHFATGQVFTPETIGHLRRFAGWVAAAALGAIVATAVTSILLTLNNPPGSRQLAVCVNFNSLFTLFFSAVIWLMADIFRQAQLLADENQSFV